MKKLHHYRVFLILTLCFFASSTVLAQKSVSKWIEEIRETKGFEEEKLVISSLEISKSNELNKSTSLSLDQAKLKDLWSKPRPAVTLSIPISGQQEPIVVELARMQVTTANFKVSSSVSFFPNPKSDEGVHYRGVVKDDSASIVSLSIYKDEIRGFIADKTGKYEIGKIKDKSSNHVIYNASDLTQNQPFSCGSNAGTTKSNLKLSNLKTTAVGGCKTVSVFFECDYQMYLDNGSNVTNVTNYVTSFFNQVATLYQNENVDIQISEIFVWTTPDPYRTLTTTASILQAYDINRGSNYNGNLAHFLTTRNVGGGIAYVNVLCNKSYAHGVSMVYNSFETYPTFSWTVECVAHELGHNFGSNHTQWCGWVRPDGTTGPLDNCAPVEGVCNPTGAAPITGGTIMSYCHQTGYGINFANGFGQLPGNVLRTNVTNATCLTSVASTTSAPTGQETTNILEKSAKLLWNAVPNATSYTVDYKRTNATTWLTLGNFSVATADVNSLLPGTSYDWRVKADCSAFSTANTFVTSGTAACTAPVTLTSSSVASGSATLSWAAVSGATSYAVQYKISASSTWTAAGDVTTNSYNLTGLAANTAYNWQVKANCSGFSSIASFNTSTTPCTVPINLTSANMASVSATLIWGAVSGAATYTLQYRKSTSGTWITAATVSTNSYSLTGLTASTAYNWQVKANCSAYSIMASFSTVASVCVAPVSLTTTNIGSASAALKWGAVSGATSYTVQYKAVNSIGWIVIATVSTTTYSLTALDANTAYNWQVKANCSEYSSTASFSTLVAPCAAPESLSSSNVASVSATLSWGVISGATNYTLQYRKSTSSTWITAANVSTNSYSLTGLTANTTYSWQVKANCSEYSSVVNFNTLIAPCAAPTSLTNTSVTNSSVVLKWGGVSGATNYSVQYKTSTSAEWTTAATVTTTSYILTGLTATTAYVWQVKASCSGYSAIAGFSTIENPCDAPANLLSSNVASTSVTLVWGAVSEAKSYTLQYRKSTSSTWITAATVLTTSYSLTGLSASTAYQWQVKASCSAYASIASFSTIVGFCVAPTSLATSNITTSSATLIWGPVSGASNYTVQFKPFGSTAWTTAATVSTTTYNLSGLSSSIVYNWQVKASCSNYSAAASFTTLVDSCAAPINLKSSNIGSTTVTLSWEAINGAKSYTVRYKKSATPEIWITAATVTTNSYNLKNLIATTAYSWQVAANCSRYSGEASFDTVIPPCAAPTRLSNTNIASASITLTWGAAIGATSYILQYKKANSTEWIIAATVETTSYSLTGLSASTAYNWQVKASCSAFSSIANFSTSVAPCLAPLGLVSSNVGSVSALLKWGAVSGATNYIIQYKKSSSTTWVTAATLTGTSYSVFGLTSNTAYDWQVKANCSNYSAPANFTTLAPACSAPTRLTVTNVVGTSATLSWNLVSGAVSYILQYKKTTELSWITADTVTTNAYSLTGLSRSTAYNWQVRANCSVYALGSTFTTTSAVFRRDVSTTSIVSLQNLPEILNDLMPSLPVDVPKFSVYPNPAYENISLSISEENSVLGEAYYRIIDFRGNIRKVQQIKESTEKVDVSSLERGTYIIQMFSKAGIIESKTLVKEE
jgi:hypothetical protein